MKKIKKIHFVGIKGVGMTPLAIISKEGGFEVTGSDIPQVFITDDALEESGIRVFERFSEKNIQDPDLVIATGAHGGFKNAEVIKARKKGIEVWTQGQAVGEFMKGEIFERKFLGVSVAGSHGKTTVTAMIATILNELSADPSYIIGTGSIPSLGLPGHFGKGNFFVSEADEYATDPEFDQTPKFLWQHPQLAVFTNIEFDHPDIYKDQNQLRNNFLAFADQLPKDRVLVLSRDDPQNKKLIQEFSGNKVTYGFSPLNDYVIDKVHVREKEVYFWASFKVMGEFNALNGLGAVASCIELGFSSEKIKKAISSYKGSKRRFEFMGRLESGALLFDDYAHHPTEIRKTLKALRQSYPGKRIVCIFQPHTYSRTKTFFSEFVSSFSDADYVVLTDIYPSSREEPDKTISSDLLSKKISLIHNNVLFFPKLSSVVEYIDKKEFDERFIVITMGAGDVYKISERLKTKD